MHLFQSYNELLKVSQKIGEKPTSVELVISRNFKLLLAGSSKYGK